VFFAARPTADPAKPGDQHGAACHARMLGGRSTLPIAWWSGFRPVGSDDTALDSDWKTELFVSIGLHD